MNPFEKDNSLDDGLKVTDTGLAFLEIAAKWARFLAIMGFIGCGLMVLGGVIAMIGGLAAQSSMSSYGRYGYGRSSDFPLWLGGFMYLIFAAVYFFPSKFLNDFAARALQAVASRDSVFLQESLDHLRKFFKFNGILVIISIALSVIFFFIFLLAMIGTAGRF
jgi:hypothetical protein